MTDSSKKLRKAAQDAELGLVPILQVPIDDIRPSPENDRLYRPIDANDPTIQQLAESIGENGILEPLVVTEDGYILSGHRRYAAARLAGLPTVPVRQESISRADDPDRFLELLREHNRQREKTFDERLREEIVSADPEEAYSGLIEYRQSQARIDAPTLSLADYKSRSEISAAKQEFLEAVRRVLEARKKFWPLSVRQIHYSLLNDPPLKHSSKPESVYDNTMRSYKALVDLLTRARLAGSVPMEAIADETRPTRTWRVFGTTTEFLNDELNGLFKGYWRDLMQSQPNHVEIVAEKNTVISIVEPVASEYCIPLTIGRGYCSLPPRIQIAKRYRKSGKEKLVLFILSDFDPDGEEIAHSLASSLHYELGVAEIEPVKVALTHKQVREFQLPPNVEAKPTSSRFKKFRQKYGANAYELEAVSPETLQELLRSAIDAVIDTGMFQRELHAEQEDARQLEALRRTIHRTLKEQGICGTS